MTIYCFLVCLLLSAPAQSQSKQPMVPQTVEFPSGRLHLYAYLWKPAGAGPFPAVLFSHGSGGVQSRRADCIRCSAGGGRRLSAHTVESSMPATLSGPALAGCGAHATRMAWCAAPGRPSWHVLRRLLLGANADPVGARGDEYPGDDCRRARDRTGETAAARHGGNAVDGCAGNGCRRDHRRARAADMIACGTTKLLNSNPQFRTVTIPQ